MLNTEKEIIEKCLEEDKKISQLVLEEEMIITKRSEKEIREELDEIIAVMDASATQNLTATTESKFQMIDGFAEKTFRYGDAAKKKSKLPIMGKFATKAVARAFSTSEINCAMGKIVAAPTAGSAGILPAVLISAREKYDLSKKDLGNGLLTATGIGQVIGKYATFAGAEGGCQAECGSAAAMAAAALVEMLGGRPKQCLQAASFALINVMGLVCDPIAGLVQYPCAFRNASGVVNAMLAADLAFAGVESIVPFDEVVQAMAEVGREMPASLRETGLGGLAGTKTGNQIRKEFLGE